MNTKSPLASTVPTRQAVLLVGFMWFAYFLNYCDRQAVFSMFPVLKSDLGFSDNQLGLVGSYFLWVYGIGSFFAGQIGDRFSKRRLIVTSLALWSLVTFATGLARSANMLLVLRAVMGISEALFMPAAIALTANAFPPTTRSRAIAALTTAQILGNVGGGWFGGWMAGSGHWRTAFFALGVVGLVFALPYFAFLRGFHEQAQLKTSKSGDRMYLDTSTGARDVPARSSFDRRSHVGKIWSGLLNLWPRRAGTSRAPIRLAQIPTYCLLCVIFPVFVFGLWLLYGWLPNFLHEKFSLNLADSAFNATVFLQGATLVGMLTGGVVADKLYPRTSAARVWLLTASLLGCAPFLHLLGNSDTLAITRGAAVGFGLFSGFFMGNIFPAAFEIVPADARASAVGVLNLFGAVVSGFGTLSGGVLKKSVGIENLLSYTALAYVMSGLALIAAIRFLFHHDYQRVH